MDKLDDIEALRTFFSHYHFNHLSTIDFIQKELIPIQMKQGQLIFRQNEDAKFLYFIPNGIVRYFITDIDGNEHTKTIRIGPTIIGSIYSLQGGLTYHFSAELMVNLLLYKLDIRIWRELLNKNNEFVNFYNHFLTELFLDKEKRELSLLIEKPIDQYQSFIKQYSSYLNDIPQWVIASYLSITPEALSRIRKRIGAKK